MEIVNNTGWLTKDLKRIFTRALKENNKIEDKLKIGLTYERMKEGLKAGNVLKIIIKYSRKSRFEGILRTWNYTYRGVNGITVKTKERISGKAPLQGNYIKLYLPKNIINKEVLVGIFTHEIYHVRGFSHKQMMKDELSFPWVRDDIKYPLRKEGEEKMSKERMMRIEVEGSPAKIEITKLDFDAYVRVQDLGVTNMLNIKLVKKLSGLPRLKILAIIKNYGELARGLKEEPIKIKEEVDEEMIIKTRTSGGRERTEKLTTEQAVAELSVHNKTKTLTRIEEALRKGTKMQGDNGVFYQITNHEEVKKVKKVKKTQKPAAVVKPAVNVVTPRELAKDLEITPLELRKVIRGLKLVRKGRFWEWDKEKDKDQLAKIRKAVLGK
jgi:hypothetical protein